MKIGYLLVYYISMKETTLKKKIQRIRKKLRLSGVLPDYGGELNEEQQLIWDQIKKGDFTYWEEFRKTKFKTLSVDLKEGTLSNQRQYIRKKLRDSGYLPPYGHSLNEEQQKIEDEIKMNDFSFFNTHLKKMRITIDYVCKICNENDIINFYSNQRSKCKTCISREMKKKYINGDFTNRYETNRNWKLNNFIHHKVQGAKHRAIRKGFEFTITDEIVEGMLKQQNGKCYFTNIELTFNTHDWNSLSIDRINNDLGYTKENIVLVTKFVNSSKNSQTNQEFIDNIKQCYLGLINNGHLS